MRLAFSSAAALALLFAAAAPAICANPPLSVTIQATQEQALRHRVDDFVASVIAQPIAQESLLRWNTPVCPLVVGLPRNWGELILARISQAARDAHAPLAGEHCEPNLFVVVSPQPDQVLKQWMANKPKVDTPHGLEPLKQFLHSTRPIRVWYNSEPGCEGGVHQPQSAAQASALGLPYGALSNSVGAGPPGGMGPSFCDNRVDTHLTYGDIRSISYAIVVADSNKLHENHVTLGQLGDYAALVGLANIQPDADGGGEPTMLRLFHDPNPPPGLTPWDRALLYSLYNTSQSGKLQLTDMEVSMATQMATRSTP
ncbi:MAG TPA: hypothetical protein VHV80_03470 [Steroidobacteraceae bacterium]|jgi:hypothetical protein|nr:hypothetical protein [Steroidobacteraceae bacterium]